MLKRRNTIHPLQQYLPLVTEQEPYAFKSSPLKASSKTTNPFLSSSSDDDLPSTVRTPLPLPHTWHPEAYSEDYYTTASYETHKSLVHSFFNTNPFLHSETTTNDENETTRLLIINNNYPGQEEKQLKQQNRNIHTSFTKLHRRLSSSSSHNYSPLQQQHLHDDHPEHERSRGLSLDLFKAPFNWSRRRRATCAASDLRRVLTFRPQVVIVDSPELEESHVSKVEEFPSSCKDPGSDLYSEREGIHTAYANEILKSSKYHPDENAQEEAAGEDEALNQAGPPARRILWQQGAILDRGVHMTSDMGLAWRQHGPQQQPQYDGSVEATDMKLLRRRHSVFSDSFMDERPWKQEVQQGHDEEQPSDYKQPPTPKRSSMVRSRTDTVLDQPQDQDLYQHRRHSSANYHLRFLQSEQLPPPLSSPALSICQRRHTVVGGSLTQQPSPIFSSFENRDVPTKVESPLPTENAALVSQDAPDDYKGENQEQPKTPIDSTRDHPYARRPWQLASRPAMARKESQSYADDFMKESERWRLNPWVTNTSSYGHAYSTSCPSPRDPRPQLRIFPHEKRPFYSDRNGFHTQPYGYEESDEHEDDNDDDDDDDEDKKGRDDDDDDDKGSRAKMEGTPTSCDTTGTPNHHPTLQERHNGSTHFEGHESQANTDRYYYEAMRWQQGVVKAHHEDQQQQQQQQQQVTLGRFDYLERSSLLSASPPPPPRTSQGGLIRRASVAKVKFYKLLLHNSQQQSNSLLHDARDVDVGDQDVYASDDVEVKKEEDVNGKDLLHHHDNHNNHNNNDNDAVDGSTHCGGGGGGGGGGGAGGGGGGGVNSSSSTYSFTSSFRARVRLTRSKSVLRQVKQRLNAAARSMISEANKAANHVGPLLRGHSLARYHREQTRVDTDEEKDEKEASFSHLRRR